MFCHTAKAETQLVKQHVAFVFHFFGSFVGLKKQSSWLESTFNKLIRMQGAAYERPSFSWIPVVKRNLFGFTCQWLWTPSAHLSCVFFSIPNFFLVLFLKNRGKNDIENQYLVKKNKKLIRMQWLSITGKFLFSCNSFVIDFLSFLLPNIVFCLRSKQMWIYNFVHDPKEIKTHSK